MRNTFIARSRSQEPVSIAGRVVAILFGDSRRPAKSCLGRWFASRNESQLLRPSGPSCAQAKSPNRLLWPDVGAV
ncbi:MAG: hypothetical protein DWQ35_10700 [Planctomycetota bacterium]|nr:MAG: hypothetical protein DWQ35_10700 [Planctomycetota bacterium]REK30211.1 MAG: hypothetical protein DWQ42_02215 [Planctomycetota bacterium]REK49250.1 MAG: hypothetical protein DWQ46_00550 [Planctomycetota bacterium]